MNWTWPPRPPPQDGVLRRLHVSVSVRYVCRSFPFFWGGRNHFGSVVGVTTWEPKIDLHNLQQVWYDRLWPKPITSRDRLHPWVHQHDWMEHPPFSIGTTSTSWRIYEQPASQVRKFPGKNPPLSTTNQVRPSDISSALGAGSGLRPFSGLVLGVDGFSGRSVGGAAVFSYLFFFTLDLFMGWNPENWKKIGI